LSLANRIAGDAVNLVDGQDIIEVAAGIILRDSNQSQQVLLAKRPACKDQGGLWEFPGGKLENRETPGQALARELKEEIGIQIVHSELFRQINHQYPNKQVKLWFYKVLEFLGDPSGLENQQVEWFELDKLSQLEFPAANRTIIQHLVKEKI